MKGVPRAMTAAERTLADAARDPGGWAPYLERGERLLWEGAPAAGLRWQTADWVLVPFFAAWTGFAVFWTAAAAGMGAPLLFAAFGLPFVALGLFMTAGRFFWDAHVRRLTRYALTDRRALVATRHAGRRIESLSIDPDALIDAADGDGTTLLFHDARAPGRRRPLRRGFRLLEDGEHVRRLIEAVQTVKREARDRGPSGAGPS